MATVAPEATTAPASTKPLKTFRTRGVSAAIFENRAKGAEREFAFHKVKLERTYKDGDEFKTTTSFGRDDLPVAVHLLQQAWAFILDAEAHRKDADDEE